MKIFPDHSQDYVYAYITYTHSFKLCNIGEIAVI
jgi:hypothetical protein